MPNPTELFQNRDFKQNALRAVSTLPLVGTVLGIACNTSEVMPTPQPAPRPYVVEQIKTPILIPTPACIPQAVNPIETAPNTNIKTPEELDTYERGLWQQFTNRPGSKSPESTDCETQKVNRTIGLMRLSTIKNIRAAGELIAKLADSNDLEFSYFLPSNDARHQNALIVTKLDLADNPKTGSKKFVIKLQININYIKNLTQSQELAVFLTHEAVHIQNFLIRTSDRERAGISREEIINNEDTRAGNKEKILDEEAEAYLLQIAAAHVLCELFPSSMGNACTGELMKAFKNYSTEEHWKDVVATYLESVSDYKK